MESLAAEIDENGVVRLLENVKIGRRTRAIVTLIDKPLAESNGVTNSSAALEFLRASRLGKQDRISDSEIEEQITEARESWD